MKDTLLGLLGNTDQAAAITGAAYLDYALEILLKARFRKLTKGDEKRMFDGAANGILGTFSAKIRTAYAIGIIANQTYRDLLLIGSIRNAFSHTLHEVDFSNDLIAEDCSKLKTFKPGILTSLQETPKQRYVFTVLSIYIGLRENVKKYLLASALQNPSEQPTP